jgi:hypothetical protein
MSHLAAGVRPRYSYAARADWWINWWVRLASPRVCGLPHHVEVPGAPRRLPGALRVPRTPPALRGLPVLPVLAAAAG